MSPSGAGAGRAEQLPEPESGTNQQRPLCKLGQGRAWESPGFCSLCWRPGHRSRDLDVGPARFCTVAGAGGRRSQSHTEERGWVCRDVRPVRTMLFIVPVRVGDKGDLQKGLRKSGGKGGGSRVMLSLARETRSTSAASTALLGRCLGAVLRPLPRPPASC